MTGFFMFLHAVICVGLVAIILMQSGRGGGLTEMFSSSAESLFGAQTNSFLIKATTIFATLYFVSCLSLAVMSAKQKKSLLDGIIPTPTQTIDLSKPSADAEKVMDEATQAVEKAKTEVLAPVVAE